MMTAEELAEFFHTTYERLAPQYGYKTREESAVPWSEVPDDNKQLMIATCAEVLRKLDPLTALAARDRPLPD
jgi:hypothetical protein